MTFSPFMLKGKVTSRVPFVTITIRGVLCINVTAVRQFELQQYRHIQLSYDTEVKTLGFAFTP